MKRTTLLKTLIVATSVFAAGNFMTCTGAAGVIQALTGNYNLMATEVQAAELEMFTGEWSYVQNDISAPEAAVIKTGDTIAVAMFKDTMIQLKVAEGVTPVITLGTETVASAVAPTGDGILIAGNQLGEGLIQVQNSVNGAVTNIVVSVLDAGNNGASTEASSTSSTASSTFNDGVLAGIFEYVHNEFGAPEPVMTKEGNTTVLTMYANTMVKFPQLQHIFIGESQGYDASIINVYNNFGVSGGYKNGWGLYINARKAGETTINICLGEENYTPNYKLKVRVLDFGPDYYSDYQSTVTCNHPGVVNGFYSYADDHKVVSADGALELYLDNLVWKSDVGHAAPKIYFAADGLLTVEAYESQAIRLPSVCNLPGFYCYGDFLGRDGYVAVGGKDYKIREQIIYYTIQKGGSGEDKVKNAATQLPVRIITLGGRYGGDAKMWGNEGADTLRPITFGK